MIPSQMGKRLIQSVPKQSGGNRTDAARRLAMHRRLLYDKRKQLGLE